MSNPSNKGRGAAIAWVREHVNHSGDECLIWPFMRSSGYGMLGYLGKQWYAHRLMCELAHGPVPSADHEASHSCGRGHQGCVNPRHLSWKTRTENQLDRAAHGTRSLGARSKIDQRQAEEIRGLKGNLTQREIAERFGISRSNVSLIQCGQTHVKPRKGYVAHGKKWRARIKIDRREITLGRFNTEEEAHAAYISAADKARPRDAH